MHRLSRAWLVFISFVANSSAIMTGTATLLAYGVANTMLPPIAFNGVQYYPGQILVSLWLPFAFVWAISQILDAITEQPAGWLNRFGFLTSLYAFGAITLSLVVALLREANGTIPDVDHALRSLYAFWGLIVLFVLALLDITVLQHIKNRSVRAHETRELLAHDGHDHDDVVVPEIVRNGPVMSRGGVPLIGHADSALVIDARGATLNIAFRNGEIERLTTDPVTAPAH